MREARTCGLYFFDRTDCSRFMRGMAGLSLRLDLATYWGARTYATQRNVPMPPNEIDAADCWGDRGSANPSPWFDCCTDYPDTPKDNDSYNTCFGSHSATQCCAMSPESTSYLALPAIHATTINLALPSGNTSPGGDRAILL